MNTRHQHTPPPPARYPTQWVSLCLTLLFSAVSFSSSSATDLTDLSLEDLMLVEVALVSRKQERLFNTPAAAYVLTQEDIRRSGATSIPEALRLVPGMVVARVDANKWAVSTRGHNGRFAQELLVLIDGRTVYTPLFSGVFWEMRDVLLEDVNRIEVIRGPGGTLWGTNAVNGIINIVTEKATRGSFVKGGIGTEERGFGAIRYGGRIGTNTYARVYAKSFLRDAFVDASNQRGADEWHMGQVGFRIDKDFNDQSNLTLQGDLFGGTRGQIYRFPTLTTPFVQHVENDTRLNGKNILGRYTKTFSPQHEISLQAYFDQTDWRDTLLTENRKTYDIDFQHRFKWGTRQELVYGFGYRLSRDNIQDNTWTTVNQPQRSLPLYSAFLQNTLTLIPNRLNLIVGSKFEHNDHTGVEYQPSTRLLFTPHPNHTLWASITRAIRTPSRSEDDLNSAWITLPPDSLFAGSPPTLIFLLGDRSVKSSVLHAFEFGYRLHPTNTLIIDFATYFNTYKDLRAGQIGTPIIKTTPIFHIEVPALASNNLWGETYGFELTCDWQVNQIPLRLRTSYSFIKMDLRTFGDTDPRAIPGTAELLTSENRSNPKHQAFLWASFTPHTQLQVDGILRYVDALPALKTKRYLECDLRLGWHPLDPLEIAISGQNLFHAHHREFETTLVSTVPTEIQRSVYTTVRWSF